jgi:hypothetical protein
MSTDLSKHKIINAESKSWHLGKPGTAVDSYHITWSPGMLVIYGLKDNITLLDRNIFKIYQSTLSWIKSCDIDSFKNTTTLYDNGSVEDYFNVLKFWASNTVYH